MDMKETIKLGSRIQHIKSYLVDIYREFTFEIVTAERSLKNNDLSIAEIDEIEKEIDSLRSHLNLLDEIKSEYEETFFKYFFNTVEEDNF